MATMDFMSNFDCVIVAPLLIAHVQKLLEATGPVERKVDIAGLRHCWIYAITYSSKNNTKKDNRSETTLVVISK